MRPLSRVKNWLSGSVSRLRESRRLRRETDATTLATMAGEVRELVRIVRVAGLAHHQPGGKTRELSTRMDEVIRLTGDKAFSRVSLAKRAELKKSIVQTRDELIRAVAQAPAPTRRLQ